MRTALLRAAAIVLGTGALVAALVVPADAAAPTERVHFHDVGSEEWGCWLVQPDPSLPEEEWPDPDYVLDYAFDVRGAVSFQQVGRSGAPGFHERLRGVETWTLGDHVLVREFSVNVRDALVEVESTGPDGTLLITFFGAGNDTWWLDGVRYRDPGHVVAQFRVHHMGTLADPYDDHSFEFVGVLKESTGLNEAMGIDPCGSLGELAGF